MAELSFASMKQLFEDNWKDNGNVGYGNTVIAKIRNANSNNTILEYGKSLDYDGDEKEALEFGERAIKNRIPFVMIAFSLTPSNQALNANIESIQISEFSWRCWHLSSSLQIFPCIRGALVSLRASRKLKIHLVAAGEVVGDPLHLQFLNQSRRRRKLSLLIRKMNTSSLKAQLSTR